VLLKAPVNVQRDSAIKLPSGRFDQIEIP